MLDVLDARDTVQGETTERRNLLNLLLNYLNIVIGDAIEVKSAASAAGSPEHSPDTPCPSQVPSSLRLQILHGNSAQHDELGLYRPNNVVIAQIKPVSNLSTQPVEVPMTRQSVLRRGMVMSIYLREPAHAPLEVCRTRRPVLAREGVIAVLGTFDTGDGEDRF